MQAEAVSNKKSTLKGAFIEITPEAHARAGNTAADNSASSTSPGTPSAISAAEMHDLLAAAADRSNLYNSLGALLAAPLNAEHLQVLRSLPEIEQPQSQMHLAWTVLRKAAHDYTLQQIDDEYHQLFIGLGRGQVVPYGSWHLTGFLMEKPLGQLRADLRRLGFERAEGVAESEDHIASLCQAMAAIILADEIDFSTERQFFNDHIGSWSDQFFTALDEASGAGFYRAVGNLGNSFFSIEKQYLGMDL